MVFSTCLCHDFPVRTLPHRAVLVRAFSNDATVLCIIAIALLVPFGVHPELLLGVIAFIAYIASVRRGLSLRPVPLMLWALLVITAVFSVNALLYSTVPSTGWQDTVRAIAYVLIFLWSLNAASREGSEDAYVRLLVRFFAAIVLLSIAIAAVRFMFGSVSSFSAGVSETSPDAWRGALIFLWPLSTHWLWKRCPTFRWERGALCEYALRTMISSVFVTAVLLSVDLVAAAIVILQLVGWAFIVYRRTRSFAVFHSALPVVSCTLLCTAGLVFVMNGVHRSYLVMDDAPQPEVAESKVLVLERTVQAWKLAEQKPLTGWGPRSFPFVLWHVDGEARGSFEAEPSAILLIAAERGFPAAIVFLLLLFVILYRAYLPLRSFASSDIPLLSFRLTAILGICGLIIQNLFSASLSAFPIALAFWIVLGALLALPSADVAFPVPRPLRYIVEVLLAAVLIFFLITQAAVGIGLARAHSLHSRGENEAALGWYATLRGIPFHRDSVFREAQVLRGASRFPDAERVVRSYIDHNDDDARGWTLLSEVARDSDDTAGELFAKEKAFERAGTVSLFVIRDFVQALVRTNHRETLDKRKVQIDALISGFSQLIRKDVQGIAHTDNVEQFIALCNTMAAMYPDEAPRYTVAAAKADHHAAIYRRRQF